MKIREEKPLFGGGLTLPLSIHMWLLLEKYTSIHYYYWLILPTIQAMNSWFWPLFFTNLLSELQWWKYVMFSGWLLTITWLFCSQLQDEQRFHYFISLHSVVPLLLRFDCSLFPGRFRRRATPWEICWGTTCGADWVLLAGKSCSVIQAYIS